VNFIAKYVRPFLKAHVAGVGAGLVLLGNDLAAGSVSGAQWEAVALTVLGVGGAVALVPNKQAAAVAAVAAVVHDVAPVAVIKDVVQDATAVIPAVQEVAAAVLPAAVAADVAKVAEAAQAVVVAVAPAAPVASPAAATATAA
jgi:hypothetical protein